ncbi:hypothetical protein QBC39DRAFT_432142, partial [Podospora conica]
MSSDGSVIASLLMLELGIMWQPSSPAHDVGHLKASWAKCLFKAHLQRCLSVSHRYLNVGRVGIVLPPIVLSLLESETAWGGSDMASSLESESESVGGYMPTSRLLPWAEYCFQLPEQGWKGQGGCLVYRYRYLTWTWAGTTLLFIPSRRYLCIVKGRIFWLGNDGYSWLLGRVRLIIDTVHLAGVVSASPFVEPMSSPARSISPSQRSTDKAPAPVQARLSHQNRSTDHLIGSDASSNEDSTSVSGNAHPRGGPMQRPVTGHISPYPREWFTQRLYPNPSTVLPMALDVRTPDLPDPSC